MILSAASAQAQVHYNMSDSSNFMTRFDGAVAYDLASFTANAGDVNGDGMDDLLVAAPGADPGSRSAAGRVYVIFGTGTSFTSSTLSLSKVGSTVDGFQIAGATAGDSIGSIDGLGDINGDGYSDILIGSPIAGRAYVVYGKTDTVTVQLSKLDPGSSSYDSGLGFQIEAPASGMSFGSYVAASDDLNGDGRNDLLVMSGLASYGGSEAASVYVIFSSAGYTDLSTTAIPGYRIDLPSPLLGSGETDNDVIPTVTDAGDINSDGVSDQLIGFPEGDYNGEDSGSAWVVYGKSSATSTAVNLTSTSSSAARFDGEAAGVYAGSGVDSAGDVDGDGNSDIVIGSPFSSPSSSTAYGGRAYVIFGGSLSASSTLGPASASQGYSINSGLPSEFNGYQVRGIGDINGDGAPDQLISGIAKMLVDDTGSPILDGSGHSTPAGGACVVLGQADRSITELDLNSLDADGWCYHGVSSGDLFASYPYMYVRSADTFADFDSDGVTEFAFGACLSCAGGSGTLDGATYVTDPDAIPLPVTSTGSAADINSRSATLDGTIDPNNTTASYQFEAANTTSFDSDVVATPKVSATAGATATTVTQDLTGLSSNRTYYYRLVGTNTEGFTYYGETKSFRTKASAEDGDVDGDGDVDDADDIDGDGDVDADDADAYDRGDLDGDGDIDADDVAIYNNQNNGSTTIIGGGSGGGGGSGSTTSTSTSTTSTTTTVVETCTSLTSGNAGAWLSNIKKIKSAKAQLKLGSGYLTATGTTTVSVVAPKGAKLPKLKSATFYVDGKKIAVDKRKAYKTSLSGASLSSGTHTLKVVLKPKKKGRSASIRSKFSVGECTVGKFIGTIAKAKPGRNTAMSMTYSGGTQPITSASLSVPTKSVAKFSDLRKLKGKKIGTLSLSNGERVTLKIPKKKVKKGSATLTTGSIKVTLKLSGRPKISISGITAGTTGFSVKLGKRSSKLLKAGKKPCKLGQFNASLKGSLGETAKLAYQMVTSCKK